MANTIPTNLREFPTVNPLEGKCPERATFSQKIIIIFFFTNWRSRFGNMSFAAIRKKKYYGEPHHTLK